MAQWFLPLRWPRFSPMTAIKETKVMCSPQGNSNGIFLWAVNEISPPPGLYENSCLDLTCNLEPPAIQRRWTSLITSTWCLHRVSLDELKTVTLDHPAPHLTTYRLRLKHLIYSFYFIYICIHIYIYIYIMKVCASLWLVCQSLFWLICTDCLPNVQN